MPRTSGDHPTYGAAQAAARSGNRDKARAYYAKYIALTEKAYLAQR